MGDLRGIFELAGLTVFLLIGRLTCADAVRVPSRHVCPLESLKGSIFASRSDVCYISTDRFSHAGGVIEVWYFFNFFVYLFLLGKFSLFSGFFRVRN